MRTSSSQAEGAERDFSVATNRFLGDGKVEQLECVRLDEQM
jgi:glutamate synthase (NADPH/NADH) small chain